MQVPRDQWLIFIYACCEYNPEDAWKSTFRSAILMKLYQTSISKYAVSSYRHINIVYLTKF